MATSGHALIKKHFRQRFGVGARQVAIRAESPWYWRAVLWALILGAALAFAAWMYDAGRRFAGFDQGTLEQKLMALEVKLTQAEAELPQLRAVVSASEGQLQVERVTIERLTTQVALLQRENTALKEELAFFEGLAKGSVGKNATPAITRASASIGENGRVRYRLLVSNPAAGRKAGELKAELQFQLRFDQNEESATMLFPKKTGAQPPDFPVQVKHFVRLEGDIAIPAGWRLLEGEVRLIQNGLVLARQSIVVES